MSSKTILFFLAKNRLNILDIIQSTSSNILSKHLNILLIASGVCGRVEPLKVRPDGEAVGPAAVWEVRDVCPDDGMFICPERDHLFLRVCGGITVTGADVRTDGSCTLNKDEDSSERVVSKRGTACTPEGAAARGQGTRRAAFP